MLIDKKQTIKYAWDVRKNTCFPQKKPLKTQVNGSVIMENSATSNSNTRDGDILKYLQIWRQILTGMEKFGTKK